MIKSKLYSVVILLLFSCFSGFSQSRKQLEAQRKQLKKEIIQVNKLLFSAQKKEKSALEDLKDLNQKIAVRNKLIANINLEAVILAKEIKTNEKEIIAFNKKLTVLKADYAEMIYKSYKSKSQQSRLMFLLSSQNFYQAYKRLEYMKQYTAFRKKQGEEIVRQTNVIESLNDSLVSQKKIKDGLIISQKDEKAKILKDKKQQEVLIAVIKKKEKQYKKELRAKAIAEGRVTAKIDKIIREAIAKANRAAAAKNKVKTTTKSNEFSLSPEAKVLATKFESNKGKLPWPVKDGLVVRRFGNQPHPTFPGITINGTGLHIVTSKNNNAEAIFNGEVLNIMVGAEGKKNVLIRHGNYISSYNNIETLFVKKGDKITTGQKIGSIFTDKVSGKTTLIFVLFKNTERLNPASWILKK